MGTKLQIGDIAPDFESLTDTGQPIRLSDYRGRRVILYFYPKDDTPGCTTQSCGFRNSYPSIQEHRAVVLGISPDGVSSHQQFKTKYSLPFTLVTDEDHSIADAYGVWGEKVSGDQSHAGIVRSHFVINEQGEILDVQIGVAPEDSSSFALKVLRMQ
ncbi:MAG: thioredoxin-dependent thiol peroxidase [Anaerolineae bacterium]|nr:thioredoxin-dependent thiol peroxidase [Anaerolineae bacterium]